MTTIILSFSVVFAFQEFEPICEQWISWRWWLKNVEKNDQSSKMLWEFCILEFRYEMKRDDEMKSNDVEDVEETEENANSKNKNFDEKEKEMYIKSLKIQRFEHHIIAIFIQIRFCFLFSLIINLQISEHLFNYSNIKMISQSITDYFSDDFDFAFASFAFFFFSTSRRSNLFFVETIFLNLSSFFFSYDENTRQFLARNHVAVFEYKYDANIEDIEMKIEMNDRDWKTSFEFMIMNLIRNEIEKLEKFIMHSINNEKIAMLISLNFEVVDDRIISEILHDNFNQSINRFFQYNKIIY